MEMVDRSGQPDERNSSKAQIRTLLEEQRQTIIAENNTSFLSNFQKEFLSMSSEFTFGDNSDKSSFFKKCFMNLVDRDLTEHQITPTLTLSRLDALLEQTRRIRLFTHTQQVDWSRQGESDCLIKHGILRLLSSVQCSSIRANLWSDVFEWIHDEYSQVEKHAQTMLQLVKFGIDWKCRELEQIVNIPVTQIVEEITELNVPVPQNVEEIAEASKSLSESRSIPNVYFDGIKVFPG